MQGVNLHILKGEDKGEVKFGFVIKLPEIGKEVWLRESKLGYIYYKTGKVIELLSDNIFKTEKSIYRYKKL